MKKLVFIIIISIIITCSFIAEASYKPVVSGNFERGDKLYTDSFKEDEEEMIDRYHYNRLWLKYKKKLTTDEYYYFKFQYYKKEYEESKTYNNIGLDLWGNYTYMLKEDLRNRWKLNIKDKDYYTNKDKSYMAYRLQYEIDYDYNKKNDYSFYIQRQWSNYLNLTTKDYFRDKINIEWDYEYNESLEINTAFQFERQIYGYPAESSNKYGKKLSIGFEYEL